MTRTCLAALGPLRFAPVATLFEDSHCGEVATSWRFAPFPGGGTAVVDGTFKLRGALLDLTMPIDEAWRSLAAWLTITNCEC